MSQPSITIDDIFSEPELIDPQTLEMLGAAKIRGEVMPAIYTASLEVPDTVAVTAGAMVFFVTRRDGLRATEKQAVGFGYESVSDMHDDLQRGHVLYGAQKLLDAARGFQ